MMLNVDLFDISSAARGRSKWYTAKRKGDSHSKGKLIFSTLMIASSISEFLPIESSLLASGLPLQAANMAVIQALTGI